jgi:hypothetical protein
MIDPCHIVVKKGSPLLLLLSFVHHVVLLHKQAGARDWRFHAHNAHVLLTEAS